MDYQELKLKMDSLSVEDKLSMFSNDDMEYLRKILVFNQFTADAAGGRMTETAQPKQQAVFIQNLTNREKDVFSMLLTGKSPKDIACILKVSYYTIDFHRKNLYKKLGIKNRAELFARYISAC